MDRPTLSLRREVLTDLELRGVSAGAPPTHDCDLSFTCFSCLTYISCNPLACVARDILVVEAPTTV